MILDSHAHLISDDDSHYPPAPLSGKLRDGDLAERFTAERLLDLMDQTGVKHICAVQRAHVYGYDNRYVIDSARRYPARMTAVVAIDAVSPQAAEDVKRWTGEGAGGIRLAAASPQVQDTDWFASAPAMKVWDAAQESGVSLCLHIFKPIREQALADIAALAARFPGIKIVIDHIASTGFDAVSPSFGVDAALTAMKDKPNLYFKLTTINLRRTLDAGQPTAPVLTTLVAKLGADKIMWGSDIAQTKGSYPEMIEMLKQSAAELDAKDRETIFSSTWQAVYGAQAPA